MSLSRHCEKRVKAWDCHQDTFATKVRIIPTLLMALKSGHARRSTYKSLRSMQTHFAYDSRPPSYCLLSWSPEDLGLRVPYKWCFQSFSNLFSSCRLSWEQGRARRPAHKTLSIPYKGVFKMTQDSHHSADGFWSQANSDAPTCTS